ncbi:MAG: hypothetical protein ACOCXT_02780 [Candidatus Dojkabacteria bacterium]
MESSGTQNSSFSEAPGEFSQDKLYTIFEKEFYPIAYFPGFGVSPPEDGS